MIVTCTYFRSLNTSTHFIVIWIEKHHVFKKIGQVRKFPFLTSHTSQGSIRKLNSILDSSRIFKERLCFSREFDAYKICRKGQKKRKRGWADGGVGGLFRSRETVGSRCPHCNWSLAVDREAQGGCRGCHCCRSRRCCVRKSRFWPFLLFKSHGSVSFCWTLSWNPPFQSSLGIKRSLGNVVPKFLALAVQGEYRRVLKYYWIITSITSLQKLKQWSKWTLWFLTKYTALGMQCCSLNSSHILLVNLALGE